MQIGIFLFLQPTAKLGQISVSAINTSDGFNSSKNLFTADGISNGKYVTKSAIPSNFFCAISCPVFVPVVTTNLYFGKVSFNFFTKFSNAMTSPTETPWSIMILSSVENGDFKLPNFSFQPKDFLWITRSK